MPDFRHRTLNLKDRSVRSMAGTKKTSDRVALGGIVAALCIVIMFLTGVVPALYIVSPMAAGLLMVILVEEVSVSWAWLTYLAVSLLSLIVTFDKDAALMFILFFGYYPILRLNLEKIRSKPLKTVCKYLLFNAFLVIDWFLTVYLLGLPTFEDTGPVMYGVLIAAFNVIFFFYDRILSRMDWIYHQVFVKRVLGKR